MQNEMSKNEEHEMAPWWVVFILSVQGLSIGLLLGIIFRFIIKGLF